MPADATAEAVTAAWRAESARLIGALTRITRDVALAEDLAQDALLAALEQWPIDGVPVNPAAWLMTIAKRRSIDHFRRADNLRRKTEELGHSRLQGEEEPMPDLDDQIDYIEDDVLRLIFLSCHPSLSPEARAALTLRLVGGLSTSEIARGFLANEATIGQRISRAKKTLAEVQATFELPTGPDRIRRLDDVMAVIYLIFNEGYSATAGDDWMRPALCEDALRLGRVLAGLMPREPEVHGLVALMELQASRSRARVDARGEPILLLEQDRALWDRLLIRRGLAALERAGKLGGALGPYALQAAIAACHARALTSEDTDWPGIAALYATLAQVMPSPIVELNRAVAVGMAGGAAAGLELVDALVGEPSLRRYHLLPAVRGDLLARLGRVDEARREFERAAGLAMNRRERELMHRRAQACGESASPG